MNGIVGIKPTLGVWSRSGIIPISHSQDTAGPMARTVRDAAILLGALAGEDPKDPATRAARGHFESDYTQYLRPDGLRGARLGVARKFMGSNTQVDRLMESHFATMKKLGAEIVEVENFPTQGIGDAESTVLSYEFKADLNAYLAGRGPDLRLRTLADLIDFNEKNASREMPWFQQELFLEAQKRGPLSDAAYTQALEKSKRLAGAEGIDAAIARHRIDAIIAPTAGPSWLIDWVNGDFDTGGCSTPAAVAGYPHVTVPGGYVHGLPVGLSFFGKAFSEPTLIRFAYAFENETKLRRAPKFAPTAKLDA